MTKRFGYKVTSCEDCAFSQSMKNPKSGEDWRQCRLHPPALISPNIVVNADWHFPTVRDADWCSHWEKAK